jgi:hypothetical protein
MLVMHARLGLVQKQPDQVSFLANLHQVSFLANLHQVSIRTAPFQVERRPKWPVPKETIGAFASFVCLEFNPEADFF